jgi:hypothetical protein
MEAWMPFAALGIAWALFGLLDEAVSRLRGIRREFDDDDPDIDNG